MVYTREREGERERERERERKRKRERERIEDTCEEVSTLTSFQGAAQNAPDSILH